MGVGVDQRVGTSVAGYTIERLLGRGGMGAVYLAEDTALARKVALKLLSPELAENERFRERFLRESRLAASLDHPHVVPIYQAGEADGVLYIAMRYVEGTDLKALLAREGALEPARALALCEQVAGALDTAHARGLVHRDVKPANVLLDEAGHAYLADFGLTKQASSISGLTGTGQLVGTVDYVAPEQVKGEPVGGRADEYALACVLYQCLAGEAPFTRESEVATLWAQVHEPAAGVSERRPELSSALDGVLAKGLAKEPSERYGSCTNLVQAARQALAAPGPTAVSRPARPRLRLVALAVATLVVAAAAIAIVALRGGGSITVAPNSVAIIDPATNEVVGQVPVGTRPEAVAVSRGSAWIANLDSKSLSRINPQTRKAKTIFLGEDVFPSDIAADDEAIWVANGPYDSVVRVSTDSNTPIKTIPTPSCGSPDASVATGEGAVWFVCGVVFARIDPTNNDLQPATYLGDRPHGIAAGLGAVWVSNTAENTVSRVSTETKRIIGRERVAASPRGVAVGEGAVWVTGFDQDAVTRLEFEPGLPVRLDIIPVGDGPVDVAVGESAVWVVNSGDGTVSRIDPRSRQVVATIHVGNAPAGIDVGAGAVWVTVQAHESAGLER